MNITRYCVGLGKTAADYTTIIAPGATTYVGCLAARTAMHAGNWDGDTLMFVGTFGAADRAEFPSNTAAGTKLPSNFVGAGGIQFGTAIVGPGSKADGVTFDMVNVTSWDMRGGTAPLGRAVAAIQVGGERTIVRLGPNTRIYPPDYNYITGAVAVDGNSHADSFSAENFGVRLDGQGRVIGPNVDPAVYGYQVDGTDGFCTSAVIVYVTANTLDQSTPHLLSGVDAVNVTGSSQQISVGTGGYLTNANKPPEGATWRIMSCRYGPTSWGGPGVNQAVIHAGDASIQGNTKGRAYYLFNIHTHGAPQQDCIQTIGTGIYIGYNYFKDITGGDAGVTYWKNNGSGNPWVLTTEVVLNKGNCIKLGLPPYDNAAAGGAPTSWLGADGAAGASINGVPELCNIAHANTIDGCAGGGITANQSGGMAILYNRIRNAKLSGIATSRGNAFLVGNYAHINPSAGTGYGALMAGSATAGNGTRLYAYNNVWMSEGAGQYDMRLYDSPLTGGANAGNVYGTGRTLIQGTVNYIIANDILGGAVVDTSAWDWDRGFPDGHWLKGAGSRAFLKTLRTCYGDIDINSNRIGPTVTPGPYAS